MTRDELDEVVRIIHEEVPKVVRTELDRALKPFEADVNIAIRGLQGLCQHLGINGQIRAAFERWEQERARGRDWAGPDEDTQPGVRLHVVRPVAGEEP
jgi:hypothetical protein